MKQRAFLFDMDGVMVDSERVWHIHGDGFDEKFWGKEMLEKMGDTTGMKLMQMYDIAVGSGFRMEREEFIATYDNFAKTMYDKTTVTEGLEDLIKFLKDNGFKLAIVSSSRRVWIEWVLEKLPYRDAFDLVFSLDEHNIISKPDPTGFKEAMKLLGAAPETTIVLEDSNAGLTSAKNAGGFTIAFTPNLVEGYTQTVKGDATAHSMKEVIEIVEKRLH